jgi:hypothetical protein
MFLRNARNAVALNYPNMVMVMFAALDDHITTTGQLPADWAGPQVMGTQR